MSQNLKIKLNLFFLIFIIGIIFVFPTKKINAELRAVDISATIIPENPKPYEDVTILLESYAVDLDSSTIEWKSRDKIFYKNTGAKEFTLKAGAPGTKSIVDIKITNQDGESAQKRIILEPSDMDILWQAVDSYVPPFYRGKALPPKEGKVKVIAIPNTGSGSQSSSYSYLWKLNDKTQQDQSGYKKNSFVFNLSNTEKENTVEVTSNSVSGESTSDGILKISGVNPKILFYKKTPGEGISYNDAFSSEFNLEESEVTIKAEPYFMGDMGKGDIHNYEWKVNNEVINTPAKKNTLTVRPTTRGGYAKINLFIENTTKLFQSATKQLIINL